jgi:hypothetical protein
MTKPLEGSFTYHGYVAEWNQAGYRIFPRYYPMFDKRMPDDLGISWAKTFTTYATQDEALTALKEAELRLGHISGNAI